VVDGLAIVGDQNGMSSSCASLLAATAAVSGSAARGFGPYSIATSWTSSARRFSPLPEVYSRGSNRPERSSRPGP